MISLLWANGSLTTGETWGDIERAMRAAQWRPFKSQWQFRRAMAWRAGIWSGSPMRKAMLCGSSRRFVNAMADRRMFMVFVEGDTDE